MCWCCCKHLIKSYEKDIGKYTPHIVEMGLYKCCKCGKETEEQIVYCYEY